MGIEDFLRHVEEARTIDLAQPYFVGMPHHPSHPPFLYGLTKAHGDHSFRGSSAAAESIALGGHVGTHISFRGKLFGGADAGGCQSYASGVGEHHADTIDPIFRRGVLLDVAASEGFDVLPADFVVDAECLQRAPSGPASRRGQVMSSSYAPAGHSTGSSRGLPFTHNSDLTSRLLLCHP